MSSRRRWMQRAGLLAAAAMVAGGVIAAEPDDAAAYAAFLNGAADQHISLVVHPEAQTFDRGDLGPRSVEGIMESLPQLPRHAAADLIKKLPRPQAVVLPLHLLDPRIRVIQPLASEIADVLSARTPMVDTWQAFRERFAGATSLLRLSPVGYNLAADEAAFIAGISCGSLCDIGFLVHVRKTAAGWKTVRATRLWIS